MNDEFEIHRDVRYPITLDRPLYVQRSVLSTSQPCAPPTLCQLYIKFADKSPVPLAELCQLVDNLTMLTHLDSQSSGYYPPHALGNLQVWSTLAAKLCTILFIPSIDGCSTEAQVYQDVKATMESVFTS